MFEQMPETRPSAVAAAWLLQVRRADANQAPRQTGVRRSQEKSRFSAQATHRGQRWRNLVMSLRQIGERLARCRLSFTDYPWDRGD
jgi:hypothetical protein